MFFEKEFCQCIQFLVQLDGSSRVSFYKPTKLLLSWCLCRNKGSIYLQ